MSVGVGVVRQICSKIDELERTPSIRFIKRNRLRSDITYLYDTFSKYSPFVQVGIISSIILSLYKNNELLITEATRDYITITKGSITYKFDPNFNEDKLDAKIDYIISRDIFHVYINDNNTEMIYDITPSYRISSNLKPSWDLIVKNIIDVNFYLIYIINESLKAINSPKEYVQD